MTFTGVIWFAHGPTSELCWSALGPRFDSWAGTGFKMEDLPSASVGCKYRQAQRSQWKQKSYWKDDLVATS
jgi:hypothetical protein